MIKKKRKFETKRLIIREVVLNDADEWFEIFNSNEVGKYLTKYDDKNKIKLLIEKKMAKYKDSLGSSFSIIEKESEKVIGSIELKFDIVDKSSEISYVLNNKFWGKGYATEAANCLTKYSFNYLKSEKIMANCNENNAASINIIEEKLNMKLSRYEKDYMFEENANKKIGFNFYELSRRDYYLIKKSKTLDM